MLPSDCKVAFCEAKLPVVLHVIVGHMKVTRPATLGAAATSVGTSACGK